MVSIMRALVRFGLLAGAAFAVLVPAVVSAQVYTGPVAQIYITAQTASGSALPSAPATITVAAAGASLSSTPSTIGSVSYPSTFANDTKVVTFVPGSYSVSVAPAAGYSYTYSSGCSGFLPGGSATCTITASSGVTGAATLTVYTSVIGGEGYSPANFSITVSGASPAPASFQGSPLGTVVSLGSGNFNVTPSTLAGFTISQTGTCQGYIQPGQNLSCTVTYQRIANYPYQYVVPTPLSCAPAYQQVAQGAPATFTAQGGVGSYDWQTSEHTYYNVGPSISVPFQGTGYQTVTVTSGLQRATCTVDILPAYTSYVPSYVPPYTPPSTIYNPPSPSVKIPSLPNTGFEPQDGAGAAFAVVFLIAFLVLAYPYVRTFARHIG